MQPVKNREYIVLVFVNQVKNTHVDLVVTLNESLSSLFKIKTTKPRTPRPCLVKGSNYLSFTQKPEAKTKRIFPYILFSILIFGLRQKGRNWSGLETRKKLKYEKEFFMHFLYLSSLLTSLPCILIRFTFATVSIIPIFIPNSPTKINIP